jgi:hypothetical protein
MHLFYPEERLIKDKIYGEVEQIVQSIVSLVFPLA